MPTPIWRSRKKASSKAARSLKVMKRELVSCSIEL